MQPFIYFVLLLIIYYWNCVYFWVSVLIVWLLLLLVVPNIKTKGDLNFTIRALNVIQVVICPHNQFIQMFSVFFIVCLFLPVSQPNIYWLQLLSCEDLLLFVVISDSKQNIFGFWIVDRMTNLKTATWPVADCGKQAFSLLSDMLLTKWLTDKLRNQLADSLIMRIIVSCSPTCLSWEKE